MFQYKWTSIGKVLWAAQTPGGRKIWHESIFFLLNINIKMETTQRNLASASSFAQCGVRLNTGAWMPAPAYGTWNVRGSAGRVALNEALAAGYRHLDTANMYSNERDVGAVLRSHPDLHPDAAVPSSSPSSSSIFVTTKFTGHGYAHAKAACELALKELGVASIDLFLIHWPGQGDEAARRESWRALEELYAAGKCRAIGVSNYTEHHLRQLLAHAKVVPAVNEFEFHPHLVQKELVKFCHAHGIEVMSYMPLGAGNLIDHPDLDPIARRHDKTIPQVILRWHLQHGVVPIPKSANKKRMAENSQLFDFRLTDDEMAAIDDLHCDERYDWDPTNVA